GGLGQQLVDECLDFGGGNGPVVTVLGNNQGSVRAASFVVGQDAVALVPRELALPLPTVGGPLQHAERLHVVADAFGVVGDGEVGESLSPIGHGERLLVPVVDLLGVQQVSDDDFGFGVDGLAFAGAVDQASFEVAPVDFDG